MGYCPHSYIKWAEAADVDLIDEVIILADPNKVGEKILKEKFDNIPNFLPITNYSKFTLNQKRLNCLTMLGAKDRKQAKIDFITLARSADYFFSLKSFERDYPINRDRETVFQWYTS